MSSILQWLDSIISFPSDLVFIKYILASVIILVSVVLLYQFVISMCGSLFIKR